MPQGTGRNDLCPCGSGQKMKHCHPEGYKQPSGKRNLVIFGVAAAVVLITVLVITRDDTPAPFRTQSQSGAVPQSGTAATQGGGTPQPPGPAPEGQVWSAEHGHWHDAATGQVPRTTTNVTPSANPSVSVTPGNNNQPTAQPPGPAPEGKVWSAEHGHWHDAPAGASQPIGTPALEPAPATTEGTGP